MAIAMNELTLIGEIAEQLSALDTGGIRRALAWLEDYFDVYNELIDDEDADIIEIVEEAPAEAPAADDDDAEPAEEPAAPATFADFFAAVAPKTAIQKAVTAAYWLQVVEGNATWKSFDVNKILRQIDVKLSSISGTLAIEEKKETPLVTQLAKSGDSMQARKTFSLTDAGIAFVEDRIG